MFDYIASRRIRTGRMLHSVATNHRHVCNLRLTYFIDEAKEIAPPDRFEKYWLFIEALSASGIHPATILEGIAANQIEVIYDIDLWLDVDSFRLWAYICNPIQESCGLLMKTNRELGLLIEFFDIVEQVYAYAKQIDFDLPENWIGRLIAEIHNRERRQRLAVHESAEALGWTDESQYLELYDEFGIL